VIRRRWLLAAAALLLVAMVGHYLWWYMPRARPAVPDGDDLPGRLLASGDLPVALWIPFPHQNLGALEESFGAGAERQRFLNALARVAGLPEPEIPGFGPFTAPPSRELVALSDEAGERVVMAARVYPALAVVSRLAGKLAGNPWLAGGEVDAFGGRAEVRWDGTLWTVGNVALETVLPAGPEGGGAGSGDGAGEHIEDEPVLASLRLERPISYLPAGTHHLYDTGGGLEVVTAGAAVGTAGTAGEGIGLAADGPALLAVSGPGGPLHGEGGAFALFSGEGGGGGLAGLLDGLPQAVVWYRPGGERFDLPAEEILSRLGERARGANGWTLLGTNSSAVAAAGPLTPQVDRLARTTSLALAADPAAALAAVDRVLQVLEAVPLIDRDELRRWRDWHTVLAPLTAYRELSVLSSVGPEGDGGEVAERFHLVLATAAPD